MPEWVKVAAVAELARRKRKLVEIGGEKIALFLVDGEVCALHDVCVHKQRSLSKGTVLHGRIICPGHQWAFDPTTGQADDQDECQPIYAVRVDGDDVYVDPRRRAVVTDRAPGAHRA